MEPQAYDDLKRRLDALHWLLLQQLAEQDPTRTSLPRALELDRALQQVNARALLAFCTQLAAKYGMDNGREA
jgi:hypothetical protein